jgi:hypothetical protein
MMEKQATSAVVMIEEGGVARVEMGEGVQVVVVEVRLARTEHQYRESDALLRDREMDR